VLVLDLYCGAGGAGRGLQLAGFEVVGIDNVPQPHYPGRFIRADAIEFLATEDLGPFNLIWAWPPCQAYSSLKHAPGKHRDADLIGATRDALVRSGKPYAIENVEGARSLLVNPITLCGTIFGLKTPGGFELQRHRLFETSFPVGAPECRHGGGPVIGIYGGHFRDRRRATGANHRSGSNIPREHGFSAMGIDWSMTTAEISDAIPPAYSRFIGEQWKRTLVKEAAELSVKSWPPPQGDRAAAKRSVATTWTKGRRPMSEHSNTGAQPDFQPEPEKRGKKPNGAEPPAEGDVSPTPEQLDEEEREFQRLTRIIPHVKGAAGAGIISISVAKAPPKNSFFRTHKEFHPIVDMVSVADGMEEKFLVVDEPMIPFLESIGIRTAPHTLYFTITADKGARTVVPVRCESEQGERNAYATTKEEVLLLGQEQWVRMYTDQANGRYSMFPAPIGRFPDPIFPPLSNARIFHLAIPANGLLIKDHSNPLVIKWTAAEARKS
jgi:DNA (cytosine-5)-methyltransferase 1